MSEEQNEDIQYVEVLWEDGSVIKCEIYDVIDFEDKTYAFLIPMGEEEDDDDTEVIVMEYVEDDEDNAHFQTIEDEDEYNRVCEYFQTLENEEYDEEE